MNIPRFTAAQRIFHLLLMLSFMLQAATGLGRMYVETGFGQGLCRLFGGYEQALAVHKAVGWFMIALFAAHLVYLAVTARGAAREDSLLPAARDLGDVLRHLRWFVGLGPEPRFERWGYWEKFDYWAVFWGMAIIGGTGLMLGHPLATSEVLPGWSLNVAFWVHRIEALLAIGHVFVIHFFATHLRRRNFPVDTAMFCGTVELAHVRVERGDWIERLERQGRLETVPTPQAAGRRAVAAVFGLTMVAAGLYLLIGGLVNAPGVTW